MDTELHFNFEGKCGEIYINKGSFSYNCSVCSQTFTNIEHFNYHVWNKHYSTDNFTGKPIDFVAANEFKNPDEQSFDEVTKIEVKVEIENDALDNDYIDENISEELPICKTESKIKNNEKDVLIYKNTKTELIDILPNIPVRYQCKSCTKSFLRPTHLEKHEQKHAEGDLTCEVCGKQLRSKASLRIHVRTHTNERPFKCIHCESAYGDQASLIRHTVRTHPETQLNKNNEILNCQFCSKKYRTQLRLQRHEKLHINEEFRCKVCGKNMKNRQALMVHSDIHKGERRYKCDLCQKTFSSASSLSDHKRRHNGEKPFKCEYCALRFFYISKLKVHQRIHTGEKPIVCEVCGKTFSETSRLNEHMLRHTNTRPHQCDICPKSFFTSAQLNGHKSVHSDDRNFQCEICSLTFKLKKTLKVHKQKHSKVKSYKCKSCSESFVSYSGLNYHMKSHNINLLELDQ